MSYPLQFISSISVPAIDCTYFPEIPENCNDNAQSLQFRTFSQEVMKTQPLLNDKKFFSSIPLDKRSEYISEILKTPHDNGQAFLIEADYPHESTFTYKGYSLNYFHTDVNPNPSALIFFIHGLNSYGGNSAYLGNTYAATIPNVNVYALDFLNFGKSGGDYRGYIQSFQDIVNQAETFVDNISKQFANNPKKFLIGNSFGGSISFKMTLNSPKKYDGIVFLVPALREIKQSQYVMKKIGKVIGYFFPKLKLTKQGTDDCKYFIKVKPLNYNGRNIPGSIRVVLNALQEIQNSYSQLDTPYILFQAGVDKLIDPFAPLDLQKTCKTKDKTTIYIKDMWHSIFYEKEYEDIIEMSAQWLRTRL